MTAERFMSKTPMTVIGHRTDMLQLSLHVRYAGKRKS